MATPLPARLWRSIRDYRRHFGLRTRITLSFAFGALFLSALLATVTFALTRRNLLDQRESQALNQATTDARNLQNQIGTPASNSTADLNDALASLVTPSGSRPVLRIVQGGEDVWFNSNPQFGRDALPSRLRTAVEHGEPARMRYRRAGEVELAIGLPVASIDGSYFEIVSLKEVDDTLRTIAVALLGAAAVTTVVGALFGWAVSRRALRPLANVTLAAESIAGGRLDTRVDSAGDADLESLTESFNRMAAALEGRVERDARFASDVSHELRSPLMTISASVDVLNSRRHELPDGPIKAALDLMVADIDRFKQLVEDLLEISRFDAGAARLDLQEVRLAELVMQAVSFSGGHEIPLDLDAELAGVVVRVDRRRVVRIVANLLDNARKYGGGATRIALEHTDENRIRLTIEDRGPGVPVSERDKIFDRFSRGVTAGRRTGTAGVGLGLSLVAEHVRLHGGRVWVQDRADGRAGACFVVELPVSPA